MNVTDESYVDTGESGVLNYNHGTFDNYCDIEMPTVIIFQ